MPTIAAPVASVAGSATSTRPEGPAPRPERPPERTTRSFIEVLGERRPSAAAAPTPRLGQPSTAPPSAVTAPVRTLVDRALATEGRIDAVLEAAAKGKSFTPAELLALQNTVFRYSQTVEVISRVTDRVVGAIKQTLGTPA